MTARSVEVSEAAVATAISVSPTRTPTMIRRSTISAMPRSLTAARRTRRSTPSGVTSERTPTSAGRSRRTEPTTVSSVEVKAPAGGGRRGNHPTNGVRRDELAGKPFKEARDEEHHDDADHDDAALAARLFCRLDAA